MLGETIWKVTNYIIECLRQGDHFRVSSSGVAVVIYMLE